MDRGAIDILTSIYKKPSHIAARGLFVKVGVRTWYLFILLGISVLQIAFVRTPEFICRTTNKGILYLVVCQYLA